MPNPTHHEAFDANPAANYQHYFVPVIGGPVAVDLVEAANLRPGEGVLDVACGTGAVTRLSLEAVGADGRVTGLDPNPGMLAVARFSTPQDAPIVWIEAAAEKIPLPDESFDVVLCGMGLQFFEDRRAGLREMRRVLAPGGRAALNLPGPIPPVFAVFEEALANHVGPQATGFASTVFSLHDADEIRGLVKSAGFCKADIGSVTRTLHVPPPEEFLWQYVHSTPLAGALARVDADHREALERDITTGWQNHVEDGRLAIEVRMTTVVARK